MILLPLVFVLALLGCAKIVSYLWRALSQAKVKGIENDSPTVYPHYDPIWGLDLLIRTWREFHSGQLSEGLRRRHEKLGHTFMTKNLGQDCIYTIDPDNIRTITTGNFQDYGKSAWVQEASKHIGSGVLMNEGDMWRRSRAMLKPIFAKTAQHETALAETHVQHLIQAIRRTDGKSFDFQDLAACFGLDLVTDFLFGKPALALSDGETAREARHFLSLVKKFEGPSAAFIAVGMLAWLELIPSYRRLLRIVHGMKTFFKSQLDAIISDSKSHSHNAGTSCFRMMNAAGVPRDQIQAELQNIFFASFDTTTALLANVVDVLSSRQDIQRKLREEISSLQGVIPTQQDIGKMVFLRFVLLETLRLNTPVTSHSRQANKDTVIPKGGGVDGQNPIFVRAGTTIVWSIYSLNRSPQFYGMDGADFRPERWHDLKTGSSFFMPFGSGPRACMGQQMAYMEIAYVVIRLLQSFPTMMKADLRPFQEAKAVSFYNGHGTQVSIQ